MPASAKLTIPLTSRRLADSIAKSLRPETDHPAGSKSQVRVQTEKRKLELTFLAKDEPALRATMNSYLRMISACLKVTEAIGNTT